MNTNFSEYAKWGMSIASSWIYVGEKEPGPINALPEDVIKEILFSGNLENNDILAATAVSKQFKEIGDKEHVTSRAAMNIWPWIAPAFSANPTPPISDIQSAVYKHLVQELELLEINPIEVGLKEDDPSTYKDANRLIEAKNFCLFFSALDYNRGNREMRSMDIKELNKRDEIFKLESNFRSKFKGFDPKQQTTLFLELHFMTRLPEEIGLFENLENLEINSNYLTFLPDSIKNLKKIKYLWLEQNGFSTFPEQFYELTTVTNLRLDLSCTSSIPDTFPIKNLMVFVRRDEKITNLPDSFKDLIEPNGKGIIFVLGGVTEEQKLLQKENAGLIKEFLPESKIIT